VTGAIFGLAYAHGAGDDGERADRSEHDRDGKGNRTVVVTANAGGAAWTPDEGNTWFTLPGVTGYWSVAFASPIAGWLVGVNGTILKISF
jgi:hypothetical protein